MMKYVIGSILFIVFLGVSSFKETHIAINTEDSLRVIYSQNPVNWPKPNVDKGVDWKELGSLIVSPIMQKREALKPIIDLGKLLFFDPRLSVSNQIACASCHIPDLNWADGRGQAVGHDRTLNKRNTPSIENTWFFDKLFWDGRAHSLEDQANGPIGGYTEMNQDLSKLPAKIAAVEGYKPLFIAAYGDAQVNNERIFHSIAEFERTISSQRSRFDFFLASNKNALNDQEIRGLHLFRTKANCMNCHNGPLFTDGSFHNIGLSLMGRPFEDLGRYNITQSVKDLGKFKTPSLRNVMRTRPWMHHGFFDDMEGLIAFYNNGNPQGIKKDTIKNKLPIPELDPLLHKLSLTKEEIRDIVAFLNSITSAPLIVREPQLPK